VKRFFWLLAALPFLFPSYAALADGDASEAGAPPEASAADLGQELDSLRQLVEKLQADREADQAEIESLRESVQTLEDGQLRAYRGTAAGPGAGDAGGEEIGTDKKEDREYQRTERRVLEQRRGVLLPAGQLLFEPGFQYTNISRNRVQLSGFSLIPAIIIGRIDVVEIDRDIFVGSLTSRYGIFNFLEAELSLPYVYRSDQEIFGATGLEEQVNVDGGGIGDLTGGLFAQVLYEKGWVPDTVLSFRFSAPTGKDFTDISLDAQGAPTELPLGSGFWGLQPGVTFSKTTDPAVVFSSFRYTFNLQDNKNGLDYDPGDVFEFNGGVAFALNERIAMSFSYQHRYGDSFDVDGVDLLRSDFNAGQMFIGMSYTMNRWTALSFNVGFGVTSDAPDLTFEIRMPLRMPFRTPVLKLPRMPWQSAESGMLPQSAMAASRDREVLLH
jgi:hypothetical protein